MSTSNYAIEKGIPVPVVTEYSKWKNLLDSMRVGDSVLLSIKEATAARGAARKHGMKVTVRKVDANTSRVWKVS